MPISLTLESCDGNVNIPFQPLTCPRRVTGTYKIVDWQRYQSRCPIWAFASSQTMLLTRWWICWSDRTKSIYIFQMRCKRGPRRALSQFRSIGMVLYWSSRQKNYCQSYTNKFSVLFSVDRGCLTKLTTHWSASGKSKLWEFRNPSRILWQLKKKLLSRRWINP